MENKKVDEGREGGCDIHTETYRAEGCTAGLLQGREQVENQGGRKENERRKEKGVTAGK